MQRSGMASVGSNKSTSSKSSLRTQTQFRQNQDQQKVNVNKLSYRHRCLPTPAPHRLRQMEEGYVVDAVKAAKTRVKFYPDPLLPKYDAASDPNCVEYFRRADIQRLIAVTRRKPVPRK